jgi:hypothetical protein
VGAIQQGDWKQLFFRSLPSKPEKEEADSSSLCLLEDFQVKSQNCVN